MIKKTALFLLILTFVSQNKSYGQVEEIETQNLDKLYQIINLGKNGLVLEHKQDNYFEWIFYNQDLKKDQSVIYECKNTVNIGTTMRFYDSITETLYIAQMKRNTTTELIIIPFKTLELTVIKLSSKKRINITSIFVFDNKAFFESIINDYSSELRRDDPYSEFAYGSINLDDGKVEKLKLPEIWKLRKIEEITKINGNYLAITYSNKKTKYKNVAIINSNEEIVADEIINGNILSPLLNFTLTDLGNDEFLVTGEYHNTKKSSEPEGIFAAKFTNLKSTFLSYFSLSEISGYSKYKVTLTGNQAGLFKYRHYLHPSFRLNNNLIIVGECTIPTIYVIGNGYQHFLYSHSVFLTIDESGNKVEEDCIKINMPETSFRLVKGFDIWLNNQEFYYMYSYENKLYKVIYKDGNIETNKPVIQINDHHESDNLIIDKDRLQFKYWYGNYYYGFLPLVPNKKYTFIQPSEYSPILVKYKLN